MFHFHGLASFLEIARGNEQHAKTFTVLFSLIFMVDFVRFSDGNKINVFCPAEPIKSLVNEDIMDQEIGQSVNGNSGAHPNSKIASSYRSRDETPSTRDGENQKKGIVFLEESRLVYVVILMEKPHQTMHDVLVRKPCHALHSNGGDQYDRRCLKKRYQGFHFNPFRSMKNTAKMATRVAAPMFFEVRCGKQ